MKNVILLSTGEYSDYCIVGVFSTEEKAMAYANEINIVEVCRIEEYTIDERSSLVGRGYSEYCVDLLRDGSVNSLAKHKLDEFSDMSSSYSLLRQNPDILHCVILARNEKQAIKIANDVRTQRIAQGIDQW